MSHPEATHSDEQAISSTSGWVDEIHEFSEPSSDTTRKQYLIRFEDGSAEVFTARPIHEGEKGDTTTIRFEDIRDYRRIYPAPVAETDYLEDK